MSNLVSEQPPCDADTKPCKGIDLIIRPREKDLGGFSVRRVLPYSEMPMVGPWIFFDHMGPAEFSPGQGIDVRPHPHINLATVTYLFEGEILHRDSLGSVQPIRPGQINLMVAGKGITHSERTGPELRAAGHRLQGLQLWLALPEEHEEIDPAFYHYDETQLPVLDLPGAEARLLIGRGYGMKSPVKTFADTFYAEVYGEKGVSIAVPKDVKERAVYVVEGEIKIGKTTIYAHEMAVLTPKAEIEIKASEESRLALIGGDTVGPRHIWWNFVSSRKERIEQAKQDWTEDRFAAVPDDHERIPLPEDR